MKLCLRITLIFLVSLIVSCTASNHKVHHKLPIQAKHQAQILCKYTPRKGVAELISIQSPYYHFVFFPGNIRFSLTQSELNIAPIKGGEYKALIEELVQGDNACPKATPQLIDLPH